MRRKKVAVVKNMGMKPALKKNPKGIDREFIALEELAKK